MPRFDGGCACGAVRYQCSASPFWAMHCHCNSCRRATGAPVSSFVGLARAHVAWTGERRFFNSSAGVTRGFCPACGTPLHYMSTRWPGEIHLHAATLDDLSEFRPTAHVHWAERVTWLRIEDDLPKHSGAAP
ncbi:MAG: GFA family protein [Pseudomonadota bacterium]